MGCFNKEKLDKAIAAYLSAQVARGIKLESAKIGLANIRMGRVALSQIKNYEASKLAEKVLEWDYTDWSDRVKDCLER